MYIATIIRVSKVKTDNISAHLETHDHLKGDILLILIQISYIPFQSYIPQLYF